MAIVRQQLAAGRVGAFTFAAVIVYQFLMFGFVAPAVFGVDQAVLADPVANMRSTSAHRPVVIAVYLAPLIAGLALNAVMMALRAVCDEQRPFVDAAWFAALVGSVAAAVEASSVVVGIPVLAGWYERRPEAAIAGMVTQQALSDGLHMLTFAFWGTAILLASLALWRSRTLPRPVAAYGLVAGALGLATILSLEPVFLSLLAFLPWFAAVGWTLPATRPSDAAAP